MSLLISSLLKFINNKICAACKRSYTLNWKWNQGRGFLISYHEIPVVCHDINNFFPLQWTSVRPEGKFELKIEDDRIRYRVSSGISEYPQVSISLFHFIFYGTSKFWWLVFHIHLCWFSSNNAMYVVPQSTCAKPCSIHQVKVREVFLIYFPQNLARILCLVHNPHNAFYPGWKWHEQFPFNFIEFQ